MIVAGPFQELELSTSTGLSHWHSAIFAFVKPWSHRPLYASGRFANGHSEIFNGDWMTPDGRVLIWTE